MQYQNIYDFILAVPVRAVYFQFAPFPLHATSIFDFLAVAILPGLIFVAVAAYRSLLVVQSEISILTLLLTVYVAGIVGYGLIDSNFGTTVRHRIPLTFLLLIFASPVLQKHEQSLRRWLRKRTRQNGNQHEK